MDRINAGREKNKYRQGKQNRENTAVRQTRKVINTGREGTAGKNTSRKNTVDKNTGREAKPFGACGKTKMFE